MARTNKNQYEATTQDWQTPDDFILILLEIFERWLFDTDVCTTNFNVPAKIYHTESGTFDREENKLSDLDGLKADWCGLCWMNPPYGNLIKKFIDKAYNSAKMNPETQVIALLPQRFENSYYHEQVLTADGIFLFRGKKFMFTIGGQTGQNDFANAPQPLCLTLYNFSKEQLKEIENKLNQTKYTGIMIYGKEK